MEARATAGGRQRGQSMVELALVLPILMLVLLGIVDLGRVFNAYIAITNASREGALYGSFYPPVNETARARIRERVLQEAQPTVMLDSNLIHVSSVATGDGGQPVTVTVEYPFAAVSMMMGSFFPSNPYNLKATTVMMVRETLEP
jgi:Flp pilus assembly protein TadG